MDPAEVSFKGSRDQEEEDAVSLSCPRICHPIPNVVCSIGDKMHRRRFFVNFLVIMFGIGACISLNGVSAELPLLVISAPEGSRLPANLSMAAVVSYVGPAIYALSKKSTSHLKVRSEFAWISIVLVFGTVAMGLLAFFYNVITTINAVDHSVVMTILIFVLGSVTASRNILLLPYLRHFKEVDLASFFIGEGLSGFIPSIVALIQGVGGEPVCSKNITNDTDSVVPYTAPPNFSSTHYFLFVFALMACTTCAFWLLEYLRVPRSPENEDPKFLSNCTSKAERDSYGKLLHHEPAEQVEIMEAVAKPAVTSGKSISTNERIYLCVLMWLVCLMAHGYLNNIEVFSSRPYGNSAYHLAVNLSQLAGTISCVLAYWLPPLGTRGVTGIMSLVLVGTTYVTWLALSAPMPLWRDTTHGVVLLVIIWMLLIGMISYLKLAITAIIWHEANDADAGIYQLGFAILVGTICGTSLVFYLINFTTLFSSYTPCEFRE